MANKRIEGDFWAVYDLKGNGGLILNPSEESTIEGAREAIDRANQRVVARGYKAEQYAIVNCEWYRYVDENGNFVKSEDIKQVVEVYPSAEAVAKLNEGVK